MENKTGKQLKLRIKKKKKKKKKKDKHKKEKKGTKETYISNNNNNNNSNNNKPKPTAIECRNPYQFLSLNLFKNRLILSFSPFLPHPLSLYISPSPSLSLFLSFSLSLSLSGSTQRNETRHQKEGIALRSDNFFYIDLKRKKTNLNVI